jgi:hypothetical protein
MSYGKIRAIYNAFKISSLSGDTPVERSSMVRHRYFAPAWCLEKVRQRGKNGHRECTEAPKPGIEQAHATALAAPPACMH